MGLFSRFKHDLALALSGDALWLARPGDDAPVAVPAYVAVASARGQVLAVGEEARVMRGHEPGSIAVLRLGDPVVIRDDPALLTAALKRVLRQHGGRGLLPPRLIIAAEAGVRQTVRQAAIAAGAREVLLVDPAMAGAIGAGLKVEEPVPRAVLVLERDTCSFAVISLAGIVAAFSAPQGMGRLLDDVALHTLATRHLALDLDRLHAAIVQGGLSGTEAIGWEAWLNEVATGRAANTTLGEADVRRVSLPFRHWLAWQHQRAFDGVPAARRIEAETAAVHLVGPYARAPGVADLVGAALHRQVIVPARPEACVVLGARAILADLDFLVHYVAARRDGR